MKPAGWALVIGFCVVLIIAIIWDHHNTKKFEKEMDEKYGGRHTADFKFGGLKGFIADNTLVFKNSIKGYFTLDLTKVKYISAYSVNGSTYVSFADENNKELISKASLGALGTPKKVKAFLELVCANANWIQWT